MPYYSEPIKREPNSRGRPRLVTVLGTLPGAQGWGFNGNGTPKGATVRLWEFPEVLESLPKGVQELTKGQFDQQIADRERDKPVRMAPEPADPEEAPLTPAENKALRALLRG